MTIIQMYLGVDHYGLALWRDCVWDTLSEAEEKFPEEIYREVTTDHAGVPIGREFRATEKKCDLESFYEEDETEALS